MRQVIRLLTLVSLLLGLLTLKVQAATPEIMVLEVKGTINPVVAEYLDRGIRDAEERRAVACIIQIDTPGGLDTSMRDIIQDILNSQVPVVVYVSPSGARAASAGVFITLASHVAAMSPNTAIGAAHPVSIGEGQVSSEMEEKILNDAVAYIKSLAESRGRNVDWAERAVVRSISSTEQEALRQNVIDLVVPNLETLVQQLDGREVTLLDGRKVTLNTRGAAISYNRMTPVEGFLYAIADPNIAYLLLSLALLGIMTEVLNPGLIFPGVVGGISLLLAFYSLGMLPVNYTGILLIVLAFALFIAEALTSGFGVLFTSGLVSLIIGSLILFKGRSPLFQIAPWLIALVTILVAGIFAIIVFGVLRTYRRKSSAGREEMVGRTAVARTVLAPEGTVFLEGELWDAVSQSGRIDPGEEVMVTKVDGLKLEVKKREGGNP